MNAKHDTPSPESPRHDRTNVFIVDDHPAVREAIGATISQRVNMRVSGEAHSGAQALEQMKRREPNVAIVDISLKDMHGLDLIEHIRGALPSVRIVVYSMYDESVYAERALRAGASAYVMKNKPTTDVVNAVESVHGGNVYLSRRMSSRILGKVIRQQDYEVGSTTERLTDREMTVFQMLGEGHTVRDIAEKLELSRKTIETYRRRAKEKLGFDTVSELLQYAVQWTYGREGKGRPDDDSMLSSSSSAPSSASS
mgnify:CR=1 FL=1